MCSDLPRLLKDQKNVLPFLGQIASVDGYEEALLIGIHSVHSSAVFTRILEVQVIQNLQAFVPLKALGTSIH